MLGSIIIQILKWRSSYIYKNFSFFNELQSKELKKILKENIGIEYLKNKQIDSISSWDSLTSVGYDDIESDILLLKTKKINTLSNNKIIAFSKSSGTTSASKFIPVTKHFMKQNYLGGFDMLSLYFKSYPNSKILCGQNFSLTGTYNIENGFVTGDISALIAYFLPKIYYKFREPSLEIATLADWDDKIDKLLPILATKDIRWIAGVPSWIYLIIGRLEEYTQKSITEIWPNFEVFFHGGISIIPFKNDFINKFNSKINFWQIYNASEGYLGLQIDKDSNELTLLPNRGTYFEFIKYGDTSLKILKLKDLVLNETYELILSNSSGLYRYRIGDVIITTCLLPLKFEIIGRTKGVINAFGEELMIHNVENALNILSESIEFKIHEFNIAPIINSSQGGHHRWYIEFKKEPKDITQFSLKLDSILKELNSDYAAKRYNNLILLNLEIVSMPKGIFIHWLKINNKLNAQTKIPKLSSNTEIQKELDSIRFSNSFLARM